MSASDAGRSPTVSASAAPRGGARDGGRSARLPPVLLSARAARLGFPRAAVRREAAGLETTQTSVLSWLHRWEWRGDEESVSRADSRLLITPVPFSPPRRTLRLIISNSRRW